ncbi:MAG TPA: SDR family NAD(P)-dependent oxidoreductase [Spirochaetia bacterium]|nr:SDR family NAD(P)-dependent oxidoreductase [Spirochaetia bacterium]
MSQDSSRFFRSYGPWALIVGGSEGIGAEFARQIAARGLSLVLVARRQEVLHALAAELRSQHSVEIVVVSLDMAAPGSVDSLCAQVAELDIGLLVCSAASSPLGDFLDVPRDAHDHLVDLNCKVPTRLTWELARRMKPRGTGGIILVSSMAGFQGTGFVAHYAASKAYLLVLAEGLWNELHHLGIDVLATCPGLVRTPTLLDGHPVHPGWLASPLMDCGPVVAQTLRALGRGPVVVPGAANRISSWITQRLLPRRAAIALTSYGTRSMYPQVADTAKAAPRS